MDTQFNYTGMFDLY